MADECQNAQEEAGPGKPIPAQFSRRNSSAITEPPFPIPSPDARRTAKLVPWDALSGGAWM